MPYSYRRKQMLNWARQTLRQNAYRIQGEFHYHRWMQRAAPQADNIVDAIKQASEARLDELYELREELRLKI